MHTKSTFEKFCEVIPGGVNSPVRSFKGLGIPPMIVDKGFQDTITDINGSEYLDFCCSWGALIHGHSHPAINKVVIERISKGSTFGITTAIEEKIARKVTQLVPSIDKIRFVSSGTEATMSAIRLSRGFTGKNKVVKFTGNYHGHADFLLVRAGSGVIGISPTSSSSGIPNPIVEHTLCLPYNGIEESYELLNHPDYRNDIAAVIIEPIAANMGVVPANPEFLKMLRDVTKKIGAVLIFDEVITGFRIGLQGAQGLYDITPDLTCFGKIIGGGFPAAAFGGRRDIMDHLAPLGSVYQAGTLSGNPVAMEAGYQTLSLLETPGFYEDLERKTRLLTRPIQEEIKKQNLNMCLQQVGSLFTLFFGLKKVENMEQGENLDLEAFAKFFRYLYNYGVYFSPAQYEACFVSAAHTEEHLEKTCDLILAYLNKSI